MKNLIIKKNKKEYCVQKKIFVIMNGRKFPSGYANYYGKSLLRCLFRAYFTPNKTGFA